MNIRACPHDFSCWYRLQGRCCHSLVEDIPSCRGHEPSTIYVELTIRPRQPRDKGQPPEKEPPPTNALWGRRVLAAG